MFCQKFQRFEIIAITKHLLQLTSSSKPSLNVGCLADVSRQLTDIFRCPPFESSDEVRRVNCLVIRVCGQINIIFHHIGTNLDMVLLLSSLLPVPRICPHFCGSVSIHVSNYLFICLLIIEHYIRRVLAVKSASFLMLMLLSHKIYLFIYFNIAQQPRPFSTSLMKQLSVRQSFCCDCCNRRVFQSVSTVDVVPPLERCNSESRRMPTITKTLYSSSPRSAILLVFIFSDVLARKRPEAIVKSGYNKTTKTMLCCLFNQKQGKVPQQINPSM